MKREEGRGDGGKKQKDGSTGGRREMTRHTLRTAGGIAGALSALITQPFEVVKTRLIDQASRSLSHVHYSGTLGTLRTIRVEEGARGLFRGLVPTLFRVIPGAGLYFTTIHTLRSATQKNGKTPTPFQNMMVGGASRALVTAVLVPITVVKTRMEAGTSYTSTYHALRSIAAHEGLRGLYAGTLASILNSAPYSALYVMIYQGGRERTQAWLPRAVNNGVWATLAGLMGTMICQPADVLRTRIQLRRGSSALQLLSSIWRREGVRGLFRGVTPLMCKRAISSVLMWVTYEEVVVLAERLMHTKRKT